MVTSTRGQRHTTDRSAGPVRPGAGGHAGRRQQPGARVPRRRRHAAVHGERPRRLPHRRRRHRVRRPGRLLGTDDPRPRPPGGGRGRAARGRATARRSAPRPSPRYCSPRRSSRAPRSSMVRLVSRAPRRPCRRSGWPAGSPGGTWSSSSPAATTATSTRCSRRPAPGSRPSPCPAPRGCRRRPRQPPSCCRTTTSPPSRQTFEAYGDQIACVITEAAPGNMGVVPPAAGVQRALLADSAVDHGALFVSDEVMTGFRVEPVRPLGARRRAEGLGAGPDDVRQGDGWRLPRGGVRRPGRRHGPARPRRARLPGRHAVRQPDRRPRPGSRRCGWRPTTSTPGSTRPPRRSGGWSATRSRRPACRMSRKAAGNLFSVFFVEQDAVTADPRLRRRQPAGAAPAPGVLPRDAGRRGLPAAQCVRGLVRERRPRRRRAGPDRRRPARRRPRPRARGRRTSTAEPAMTQRSCRRRSRWCICCATARWRTRTGVLYGRMPDFHLSALGVEMAQTGREDRGRSGHHATWSRSPLERAQETDGADRDRRSALDVATDERVIEAGERVRGPPVRRRATARCADPSTWRLPLQPVPARPGASRTRTSSCGCSRPCTTPGRPPSGHEALDRVAPAADLDGALPTSRAGGCSTTPARRQCGLASLTSVTYRGEDVATIAYSEPAADLVPAKAAKKFTAGA